MVAAVAYQDQRLLSLGYGTIKKGSTTAPDGDTIFRIGSITKVFVVRTCYLFMMILHTLTLMYHVYFTI